MEQLNNNSKEKASVAPVNYETMLAKGLVENGAEVDALSVPAVAAFPHSIYKHIAGKKETIENDIQIQWVPFINIQGLKQITIKSNVEKPLEKWLQENKNVKDKVVLMYSIYPPYTEPAVQLCKEYGCHLSAVITDLPEYMYSWKNMKGIRGWYSKRLSEKMLELQGRCDSYILFTKPMAAKMGIQNKPYMVSEGFCDASIFDDIPEQENIQKKRLCMAEILAGFMVFRIWLRVLCRLIWMRNYIYMVLEAMLHLLKNVRSRIPASSFSGEWIEKQCLLL